ncbi:MAG TPA: hypothetical protein VNF46_00570 [Gammaproteobacteria bacterium]|nr:hypothetical protein [Gammaproteobacteria bacterium]
MALWSRKKHRVHGPTRLPSYVRNVNSANCLFCPYGTDFKVGDRVIAWDEKTVFGREQRERLVEITAVKIFRTNGRVVTLDFVVASEEEVTRIAADSEIAPHVLLTHRIGKSTYDTKNPPMVMYFRACKPKDSVLGLVPDLDITVARGVASRPYRRDNQRGGFIAWLLGWTRKKPGASKYDRNR